MAPKFQYPLKLTVILTGIILLYAFSGFQFYQITKSENDMETIKSNDGTLIAFRKTGSGPPLVLIHGGTADYTRWNPVLPELEQKFTVYAVDRRGRGRSTESGEYSIQREFEDVAAVADAIGKPVFLIGHSLGAFISLEASLLTKNISKLVLYEPPTPGKKGLLKPETAERMNRQLEEGDRSGVVSTFMLEVALIPPAELKALQSSPAWQGRVAAAHTIYREINQLEGLDPFDPRRFSEMKVPTLLLLGGDSPPEYKSFIELLHETLPDSKIAVMPGQQHVAMNTAPGLFVSEVLKFLIEQRVKVE
jgi:pimeloyl-ACP methyl ester carboxylesterase